MWAHGFISKSEAAWLEKIASHEQPTIKVGVKFFSGG